MASAYDEAVKSLGVKANSERETSYKADRDIQLNLAIAELAVNLVTYTTGVDDTARIKFEMAFDVIKAKVLGS